MAGPCSCTVAFTDPEGVRHSVQISAESLFEAAATALKAFQNATNVDCKPGGATVLEVSVSPPVVTHHVAVNKLKAWLASNGRTPREQALKHRLREMLDGGGRNP